MSVNNTVARLRSDPAPPGAPVRNSSIWSNTASASPRYGNTSLPGSCTYLPLGIWAAAIRRDS